MIKAIETRHKGYRFRSRLEARWAVFFDALGLDWEYEPEGFDLGDAGWYLPDFRITGADTNGDMMEYWFEIKPKNKPLSEGEKRKIKAFAEEWAPPYAGAFLLCHGLPGEKRVRYFDQVSGMEYILWSHRRRPWWCDEENGHEEKMRLVSIVPHYHLENDSGRNWLLDFWAANHKARAARFEHGETP